jgi:GNAT superfamily N-acetyltransferase
VNVRAPRTDDLDEVLALSRAADEAVWDDSDWTEQDLRELWDELDLECDAWVVDLDGQIAGWATFEVRAGRTIGDGYVHPAFQGRGVGSRLVSLYEARAAESPEARTLESAALRGDGSADELFRARGYQPVRHFFRMLIEHNVEPEPPQWPAGIDAAPFDLADAEPLHAALTEAFAEEWGFTPEPFEAFRERRLGAARFDAGVCWVAKEGGETARSPSARPGAAAGWARRSCARRSASSGGAASPGSRSASTPRTPPAPRGSTSASA